MEKPKKLKALNARNKNTGDWNSGNWNKTDYSNGCFNTLEPTIYLFNKPSALTYREWRRSKAHNILSRMPMTLLVWVDAENMTEAEKKRHPESDTTGGYLKRVDNTDERIKWWRGLSEEELEIIDIPNFDEDIFKEITGIDIDNV